MSIEGWSPRAEDGATLVTAQPESNKIFSEAMAALKRQAEVEEQVAANENEAPSGVSDSVPVEVETTAEGVETAEFNPETAEGLRNLLDATEDIYSDIAALRQPAERDGFKTLIEQGMPPEQAYTIFDRGYDRVASVQELVTELREERLPAGEPVKLEEIDRLQSLIDILSDERRRVQKAYDRPAPAAPATTEHEAINRAWDDVEGTAVPEPIPAPDTTASVEERSEEATETAERDEVEQAVFEHIDQNRSLTHAERAEVHELLAAYRDAKHEAVKADWAEAVRQKIDDLRRVSAGESGAVPEGAVSKPETTMNEPIDPVPEDERVGSESSEPGVLFGLRLPEAGPEGVFSARSFREGLIVTRDRHPELIKDPEKQQTVDRMVRLLRDVPASGLTEATVTELEELANSIDISEGLIPARQAAAREHATAETLPPEKPLTEAQKAIIENLGELAREQARKRRGAMSIETDPDDDGDLEISVKTLEKADAEPTKPEAPPEDPAVSEVSPKSEIVAETVPAPADSAALAAAERHDPVNRAMPNELMQRDESKAHELLSESTQSLLEDPEVRGFVATRFSSPRAYERFLETEVEKIEAETADPFEKWLGEGPAGTFETYLKEKTVAEFRALMARPRDDLRAELRSMNLKYETFSAWEDIFTKLDEDLDDIDPDLTFGELIAMWITYSEMSYYEDSTSPSQFTA